MRSELERIAVPGEHEARERAWAVVSAAFAERAPSPRQRSWKPLVALAMALVVIAGLLSPPGRAVLDEIREAVGVEKAQPALFSLPTSGSLLVTSDAGAWVVARDGSKRLLGPYRDAAWSPFGRFVVATRSRELVTLTPSGEERWSLARRRVRSPQWSGTRTDTRIAFVTDSRLHVVGGDGRGDIDAGGGPAPRELTPVWRPRHTFELSYLDVRGRVRTFAVTGPGVSWESITLPDARQLSWAPDGKQLVVVGRDRLVMLRGSDGHATVRPLRGVTEASFAPDGRLALVRTVGDRSELLVDGTVRFSGRGALRGPTWSPDGRWLLVAHAEADQWLFVQTRGASRLQAVGNVSSQFRSRSFPTIRGWCCAP